MRNFRGLRDCRGPVYDLDGRSVGVQISGVAGGKVAENGIAVRRRVALSGSLIFLADGICDFQRGTLDRSTANMNHASVDIFYVRVKK